MRKLVRRAALALYLLVVLLFMAGYLARYLHPRYLWWIQLVAVGLPWIAATLVLVTPVLLYRRVWGLLVFHSILLIFAAARFVTVPSISDSEATEAEQLRVLTFNLAPAYHSMSGNRKDELVDFVRQQRPDVIALQETYAQFRSVGRLTALRSDARAIADSASYVVPVPEAGAITETFQPLLSRLPIEEVKVIDMGTPRRNSIAEVVRAQTTWRGRSVVIYNVHLQSFGIEKPWREENDRLRDPAVWLRYLRQYRAAIRQRAQEAEFIADLLASETEPVLIAGDLNATVHNWEYYRIARDLQDAFREAGSGWGGTYHARLPAARIDFVLVSDDFEVLSATVPPVRFSDHRPLVASVRWAD